MLSSHWGIKSWVVLGGWLHTRVVYRGADGCSAGRSSHRTCWIRDWCKWMSERTQYMCCASIAVIWCLRCFWAAYDIIPTISGKPLLASGLWGWCRHPNYLGTIMCTAGASMTCGKLPSLLSQTVFMLLLLLSRLGQLGLRAKRSHHSQVLGKYHFQGLQYSV